MSGLYNILFSGELPYEVSVEEAAERLASIAGIPEAEARRLILDGQRQVVMRDVDAETAERYRLEMATAGLAVDVEPVTEPGPAALDAATPEAIPHGTSQAGLRGTSEDQGPSGPEGVPAGHGLSWIVRGFWHFKSAILTWVLITAAFIALSIAVSLVPFVGGFVASVLSPILIGGAMYAAREQDQGREARIAHLFAGFSNRTGQLALVGLLYVAGVLVITVVAGIVFGVLVTTTLSGVDPGFWEAEDPARILATLGPWPLVVMLAASLLFIPLLMAVLLAPALILLDGMRAAEAMQLSFAGCIKNVLPFAIYGLIALFLIFLGALPFGLGLLVVWPTLTAAIYVAYRDIFFG